MERNLRPHRRTATHRSGTRTRSRTVVLAAAMLTLGLEASIAQIPADSLALWLRADAGVVVSGPNVLEWQDQSGHGRHATASGNVQLVGNLVNGHPAVQLFCTGGMLMTPAFQTFADKRGAIFVVARTIGNSCVSGAGYGSFVQTYYGSGTTWQFGAFPNFYGYYDGVGSSNFNVTTLPVDAWGIVTMNRTGNTTMDCYKSGIYATTSTIADNQPSVNPVRIGASSTGWEVLNGYLAEIILYNKAMTPQEIEQVNTYLADKYMFNGNVPLPIAQGATLCGPGSTVLTATGGTRYRWFDSATAIQPLDTNASFNTPVLAATTTYYVANFDGHLNSQRVAVTVTVNMPGTACDDGNPNSVNDALDANCNCVGTLADDCLGVPGGPAQPGTPCDDGQAQTGNDTWDANCNCIGQLIDCLGVPGGSATIGSPCDDGNSGTSNDVYDANCICAGTPIGGCTEILTLDITLDNNGAETTWEIRDETGNTVILSGGPYQNGLAGTTVTETLCLNQLCYRLVVNDNGGDGISGGGYVLRDANNRRIVDANGAFTNTSSVANEFCLPLSAARLIHSFCDRTDLLYKTSTQIYASFYPGASGYQFWIFDPHGSYSRRVFSATQNLVPANLVTNPVPADMDLNVRVRALVGGNYTEFGAACRFRLNTPGGGGREAILFDEAGNMTMSLYPNPNRGEVVNVAFDGIAAAERMDIEVLDIFGKRVSAQQIAAPGGAFVHTMDLSALAPGVYLVNVRVNDRFHTQRLVRQ